MEGVLNTNGIIDIPYIDRPCRGLAVCTQVNVILVLV